ncbi:MAG: biotin--[acetyl-CoA-carboxylase] ligase [Caulobacterales bacterium]|uniref:biotin--[acetyl-CoA-carboxylase] ligase n=1 Tax=Glycocaulis sp. TaxID=1969725 RepID=UPI003FA1292F
MATIRIDHYAEIDSTNEEARRRALAGERGPVWIRADRQNAGRGRRGREWISRPGNLFITGLYVLDTQAADAARLSFAAALSVADLVAELAPTLSPRLKWPNDVLVEGRKICGILLESGNAPGGGLWLAVGIGVNLAHHPEDAERPATSLAAYGVKADPAEAGQHLAEHFDIWLQRWQQSGFAPLRDAWLARAHGLGEKATARLESETVEGVFVDLMPDGALRLDLADGSRRVISAGDVFFPALMKG